MLCHNYVSDHNSDNEDLSKAYCRIKGIILLSLDYTWTIFLLQ